MGIGSKRGDVEAIKPGEKIAIEVETGRSHTTADITSLLPLYDKVVIFVTNGKAEQKIDREIKKQPGNKKLVIMSTNIFS